MLTKISLNRATVDNAGLFCDAGSTLAIADGTEPGTITLANAQALIDSHGAEAVEAAAEATVQAKFGKPASPRDTDAN